ncbi:MAG: hypothetical protein GQE15_11945 [Archangiaceae bacterium]|nr:hypothetical protein [Archangiaceae bacterium]
MPYIRPADMTDEHGVVDLESMLRTANEIAQSYKRSALKPGDLVCSIGPSFGKVMVVPDALDGANLTQGTARIAVASKNSPRFVFWFLRSSQSMAQWESSVGGATFRSLNLGPLAETSLPLPPKDEQAAIASFLDGETSKIDALIAEQERLIELLKEKRQATISHAVTKGLNPIAPMKESGIEWLGQIPAHWRLLRAKTASVFSTSGPRGWSDRLGAGEDMFVQSGDLVDGKVDFAEVARVAAGSEAEAIRTRLEMGDVLVCITGAKTGNVALCVSKPPRAAYINQHLCLLRPNIELLEGAFASAVLRSDLGCRYFELSQYGLKQGLSLDDVRNAPVPVPPLGEQKRILEFVDSTERQVNSLVSESRRAVELLVERRGALISGVVTGQIDVRETSMRGLG